MNEAMRAGAAGRAVPRTVNAGAALAIVSAGLLLVAPVGYATGVMGLGTALLGVFLVGFVAAAAAAILSLVGLIIVLRRPPQMRNGAAIAAAALIGSVVLATMPGRFLISPKPAIHDISTDTVDPPAFVAVLPLRADAPNPVEYGGEAIATQQRAAYPDLQPLVLPVPPAQAYERALATVQRMEWDLVDANGAAGRIEATDTTFWFRFKDDVVVRIRPEGTGSRIDVRSLSRVGGGDAGTNAERIRAFLTAVREG
jgi:uncharacterized protein (DUF1499 family)